MFQRLYLIAWHLFQPYGKIHSFYFHSMVFWNSKIHLMTRSFFLINSHLLARIGWYGCISKSQRFLWVSFSWIYSGFWIYFAIVKFWSLVQYIIIISLLVSFSHWWSFIGIWVTASLLRSPGHFWVLWQILMLWFEWYQFFLWFPVPPESFFELLGTILSTPTTIGTTGLSFHFLSFSFSGLSEWQINEMASYFFLLIITNSDLLAEIRWLICISKSQRIFCISFFRIDSGLFRYV